jgi:hypothetical protein
MQADGGGVIWRTRSPWEAVDLGIHLLQCWMKPVFFCYLAAAVPLFLAFATTGAALSWLPLLLIWCSKPWLDRTVLFALSRALFGISSSPADVWRARGEVWGAQFFPTLTLRRLTASRSFTQPVLQLEGLHGAPLRERLKQITARHRATARAVSFAFCTAELALFAALFFLEAWLAPHQVAERWSDLQVLTVPHPNWMKAVEYAAVVLFLEPFYVAAGFGLYLNRRVELEAWDIEQEFRRAFA